MLSLVSCNSLGKEFHSLGPSTESLYSVRDCGTPCLDCCVTLASPKGHLSSEFRRYDELMTRGIGYSHTFSMISIRAIFISQNAQIQTPSSSECETWKNARNSDQQSLSGGYQAYRHSAHSKRARCELLSSTSGIAQERKQHAHQKPEGKPVSKLAVEAGLAPVTMRGSAGDSSIDYGAWARWTGRMWSE